MRDGMIGGIRIAKDVKDKNEYCRHAAKEEFPLMMLSEAESDNAEDNIESYTRQMKLYRLLASLAHYSEEYERENIKADEHGNIEIPVMYARDFRHFCDLPPRIIPSKPVNTHAINILYKDIHAAKEYLVYEGEQLYRDTSPYDMNLVIDLHELYKMEYINFYGSKLIVRESMETKDQDVIKLYEFLYVILKNAFDDVKQFDVDYTKTPLQEWWNNFLYGDIFDHEASLLGKAVAYCLAIPRRVSFRAKTVAKMLPVIFRFHSWDWRYNIAFLTESLKFTLQEIRKGHEIPSGRYLRCRAIQYVIEIFEYDGYGEKLAVDYSKLKWHLESATMVDDSDPIERERSIVSMTLEGIELGIAFEIINKDMIGWWD